MCDPRSYNNSLAGGGVISTKPFWLANIGKTYKMTKILAPINVDDDLLARNYH